VSSTGLAAAPDGAPTPTIALLENLPDAIVLLDDRGLIAYANAAAEHLYGRPIAELAGMPLATLLAEPFAEEYGKLLELFGRGETLPVLAKRREVVARQPNGSAVAMELSLSEVRVGQVRSLAAVGHDIRDRKREEARLRQMAEQDSLTGLVNRVSFEHALTRHVEYAARYGNGGSVIALGIDSFKYVNESLGVAAGDQVLADLAELIGGRLRKTDVFARVGGDVLGILVHGADRTKALGIADELLALVRRHAFVVDNEGIRITLSAGVTSLDERSVIGAELLAEARPRCRRRRRPAATGSSDTTRQAATRSTNGGRGQSVCARRPSGASSS